MDSPERRTNGPEPAEPVDTAAPMALLEAGVPLSLLLDLARPDGPDSPELLAAEPAPDSVWYRTPRIPRTGC